jgi:hydrogenase maturation protein HypF
MDGPAQPTRVGGRVTPALLADRAARRRARVTLRGAVQGVGFRPFVYRLAASLGVAGWIANTGQGVFIEAEGDDDTLSRFLDALDTHRPPHAVVVSRETVVLDPVGYTGFEIRTSEGDHEPSAFVLPDIATCVDCLREVFDSGNRRFRYPFTNCTNCGPRFSIITDLPYDRERTSMARFSMCAACRREYEDPDSRRFHAQPNACPICGPVLTLADAGGTVLAYEDDALRAAAAAISTGRIVAMKGLGGFLLLADAANEQAIRSLRVRKRRDAKPFALLLPSLAAIERECEVSTAEARLLASPEAPIVLLRRRVGRASAIAPSVAPDNPYLGAILPYTPLHHLLIHDLGRPLVATSGNLSDEPICIDEHEAVDRLHDVADLFLLHNRPIVRHVDDSIARIVAGREMVLRRARGYAPLPVQLPCDLPPTLAVGAHLKNAVGVSVGKSFFVSQHIGDLETTQATDAFERVITAFQRLYSIEPARVVADLHPDYRSTQYARALGLPMMQVQHHLAHVLSCMAENGLNDPVLGIAWDGTGYGTDGTIWGGEFLVPHGDTFDRVATFRAFRLPGGEAAIRDPRRSALGLLHAMCGHAAAARLDLVPLAAFTASERRLIFAMLARGINSPLTTSVGRLFDAVASLCGLCQRTEYEGQAAMALEFAVDESAVGVYSFRVADDAAHLTIDWRPAIEALIDDLHSGCAIGAIAARFHNGLVRTMVDVATRVGIPRVVLTGGCFQNRVLLERAIRQLEDAGFRAYWHQRVPPHDGGIAIGQAAFAARTTSRA